MKSCLLIHIHVKVILDNVTPFNSHQNVCLLCLSDESHSTMATVAREKDTGDVVFEQCSLFPGKRFQPDPYSKAIELTPRSALLSRKTILA